MWTTSLWWRRPSRLVVPVSHFTCNQTFTYAMQRGSWLMPWLCDNHCRTSDSRGCVRSFMQRYAQYADKLVPVVWHDVPTEQSVSADWVRDTMQRCVHDADSLRRAAGCEPHKPRQAPMHDCLCEAGATRPRFACAHWCAHCKGFYRHASSCSRASVHATQTWMSLLRQTYCIASATAVTCLCRRNWECACMFS